MSLLELDSVCKSFGTTKVLSGSLILAKGEHAALIGPSGCGKSTLLHLISGVLRPDSGTITLDNNALTDFNEERLDAFRARYIGYVFQTFHLLEGLTALENVEVAITFAGSRDYSRAKSILLEMGLGDRLHFFPHQLSVGQRQRVAVARAVVNSPPLLLADEPTANLDPQRANDVIALLRDTCRQSGAALLVATHDRDAVAQLDRVIDFHEKFKGPL